LSNVTTRYGIVTKEISLHTRYCLRYHLMIHMVTTFLNSEKFMILCSSRCSFIEDKNVHEKTSGWTCVWK